MSDLTMSLPSAQPPAGAPGPAPRFRRGRILGIVIAGILLMAFAARAITTARSSPSSAAVGDCLRRGTGDAVAVVPCDRSDAEFEVVGRVEDQTEIEAGTTTCDPFAHRGATQIYWEGQQDGTGFVLCLADTGR
jgi:hypothetical protein